MKAWHKLLGLSIAASSLVVGCVVGSDDGSGGSGGGGFGAGGLAGSGGTTGGTGGATGGTTTGGTTSGGSGGTTGGTTSGGSGGTATGGTGGSTSYTCDMPAADACSECAAAKCCTDYLDCVNDPDCLGPDGTTGDMACVIQCTDDVYTANQAVTPQDVTTCASMCGANGGIIGANANALIGCVDAIEADSGGATACGFECFSIL